MFSQLLSGGRSTFLVAFLAGLVATALSVLIGVTAGYFGGLADDLLSMLANIFLVMPALPLLIILFGFLRSSGTNDDLIIGLTIAVTGWAWGARVLRAQTLSLRSRDYVDSARLIGERGWRIITTEILPNLTPVVASSFLFTVLYGVGTYTALAFLGLVNPDNWSWGSMLFYAQLANAETSGYWWWFVPPGLAVALLGTVAGAAELRHRRVHQPPAAGGRADQEAGAPPDRPPAAAPVRARPDPGHAHQPRPAARPRPSMTLISCLEARGLCVDYGTGPGAVHAVADADLVLHRGEVLGLAGESGSGKSTLAFAITRLLRAPGVITGGEVRFSRPGGRPVDMLEAGEPLLRILRWSQISLVMQSAMNALNPVMSIRTQLTDALRAHRPGMSARERRARAAELLDMVGISADRLGSYPHQLSGGMRQRVMIAMALGLEPQVVIMDEPTTALDVVTQREILEELTELRDRLGFAILFITHDLSLLIEIADTIAVMYAGRVVEQAAGDRAVPLPAPPVHAGAAQLVPRACTARGGG